MSDPVNTDQDAVPSVVVAPGTQPAVVVAPGTEPSVVVAPGTEPAVEPGVVVEPAAVDSGIEPGVVVEPAAVDPGIRPGVVPLGGQVPDSVLETQAQVSSDEAGSEARPESRADPELPAGPVQLRLRRAPRYLPFGLTGALIGVITGVVLALSFSATSDYSIRTIAGYFAAILGLIGALAALTLVVLLERTSRPRS